MGDRVRTVGLLLAAGAPCVLALASTGGPHQIDLIWIWLVLDESAILPGVEADDGCLDRLTRGAAWRREPVRFRACHEIFRDGGAVPFRVPWSASGPSRPEGEERKE